MDHATHLHARPRRRRRLAALLALAVASGSLGAGALSLAIFTDSQAVSGNAFSTGTIVLGVNPASALLSASGLMPGSSVSGTLVVSNAGTGALRYAMTSSSTNADGKNLRDQLTVAVRTLGSGCGAFDGTSLYSGALSAAAFGNPAQGAQAGDRALAAGTSETLCFQATLPLSTGNAFQGAATTATFTFNAEQTANN